MQSEIDKDKRKAIANLKEGLAEECADNLTEVMINLENGTCDYLELIPVLEEVARTEWFYYFDDNGAGGLPHADTTRKTSFKSWALKAIENINENAQFESSSMIHKALKSNNTQFIKATLEQLKAERTTRDRSLIPILEKIVRKDIYKKYSYGSGFETDCQLGDLARAVTQIIDQHSASVDENDNPASAPGGHARTCSVCGSLPDDITVNTGRDEYFPDAYSQLVSMDNEYDAHFRCCPGCRTYFNWIDMRQMYGSGNNDEERLVRLSTEKSRLLDKLFSADPDYRPDPAEVEQYITSFSLDLLIPALRFHLYGTPEFVAPFVPHLMRLLGKNNDTSLWEFLRGYISTRPERAKEVVEAFRSSDEYPPNRLIQILHHCLRVLK
jgi:hypothetical protein